MTCILSVAKVERISIDKNEAGATFFRLFFIIDFQLNRERIFAKLVSFVC